MPGRPAGTAYRGQVAQLVEQRTENPRVDGSIPSLATTSKFLICMRFSGITRGLSGVVLPRNRLTSGLSEIGPFERPGRAAGLAIWEPGEAGDLRGAVGGVPGGARRCPGVGAGATRGAGHGGPHGHIARDPLAAGR